jgi:hypothetical protein
MAKAKGDVFLTELTPVALTVEQEVVCTLTDTKDVLGVAWSPKYRKWRAYLHVGQVQVHHSLHELKSDAIAARHSAEVKFLRSNVTAEQVKEWYPSASFRRTHRAPKVAVRRRALVRCRSVIREMSRLVSRAAATWTDEDAGRRRSPMKGEDERAFGRRIGQLMALAEYLRMTGDVQVSEIEEGMLSEVERLVTLKA